MHGAKWTFDKMAPNVTPCKNDTKKVASPAKHISGGVRLYQCSRQSGCSGTDRDFGKKNPAVAAAGPMTLSCTGS